VVERGSVAPYLGKSEPALRGVNALARPVAFGSDVAERAGTMPEDELETWVEVEGSSDFARKPRQRFRPRGLRAVFVGDQRAAQLEKKQRSGW
jgi:hypothetical protein